MQFRLKVALALCAATAIPWPMAAFAGSTLAESVEQAILRNPEVMARYHALNASEAAQRAARGAYLPSVDVQAFAGKDRLDYPTAKSGWFTHPGASIQLRQILFDGFGTNNDVKRSGYDKLARYYELLGTSDDTAVAAAQAYIDVLRYRKLVALARDNWATHREVFTQIEERVKAGVGRRVDLELAAGRLALAQSNWLTETSNLHDVAQRYRRIVGELPTETLAEVPDVTPALPKTANPIPEAIAANPAFRAAVANLRAARADADMRRASNLPTIALQASRSLDRNQYGTSGALGAPGNYSSTELRIVLNYNLFRGGSDHARARQGTELYYAAIDLRDKTCRDLAQSTAIALNDVRTLREQLDYLQRHTLSTEKARDAYRQQFDIGQRTLLDLLDTENELFESRRALNRAQADFQMAQFRVLGQAHQILPALKLLPLAQNAPDEDSRSAPDEDAVVACSADAYVPRPLDLEGAMTGRPPLRKLESLAPPPPKPAPAPSSGNTTPTTTTVTQSTGKTLTQFVTSWASAWAAKDFKRYIAFYSDRFTPANTLSLDAWRASRERNLAKPGPITVALEKLTVRSLDDTHAEAIFTQRYTSEGYSDTVQKTLSLAHEKGAWNIVRETTTATQVK